MLTLTRQIILVSVLGLITVSVSAAEQTQKPVAVKTETQHPVKKKADEGKPDACQFKISLS